MFQVKYADVGHLANLFRAFGATVQPDSDLRALSVRAPKEVLAAIEESLQRLDVPQPAAKNIDLNAYLLTASQQGHGKYPARTRSCGQAAQDHFQLPQLPPAGHACATGTGRVWRLDQRSTARGFGGFDAADGLRVRYEICHRLSPTPRSVQFGSMGLVCA